MNSPTNIVERHVCQFFSGHDKTSHQWVLGPAPEELPELRVLSFSPGKRTGLWTYCSVGASTIVHPDVGQLEFFLLSPVEDLRIVELVTMTAWYHKHHQLGIGHTLPIGGPWLQDSLCDHMLICTPYPFGPDLEICTTPDTHVHVLWMLPITAAERAYKAAQGLKALERKFDTAALEYWDVNRNSVV